MNLLSPWSELHDNDHRPLGGRQDFVDGIKHRLIEIIELVVVILYVVLRLNLIPVEF